MTDMDASARPRDHDQRGAIDTELHARTTDAVTAPTRIRRATFLNAGEGDGLSAPIEAFARWAGIPDPLAEDSERRLYAIRHPHRPITVERHNEFITLTWQSALDNWTAWPNDIGLEHFSALPLVAATRLDLTDTKAIEPAALAGFNPPSLCYSEIYGGRAQVATDFVRDADGYTRFEVAVAGCGSLRCGVIVRRLLEIETYASLILLALPLARAVSPNIREQERNLAGLMALPHQSLPMQDNREMLARLHTLSNAVNQSIVKTEFRFAASRAYGTVLATRLTRLEERSIAEYTTIERYLSNRVEPALATCRATEKRLSALGAKLQAATELVNAHISLHVQTQNQDILDTISQTSRRQYRLQETVEGLSIIAISYYALAILGYAFEGMSHIIAFDKGIAMLVAAPLVLACVWLGLRSIHRRHG
jgi:uncharacterized membrane-anchored protein